MSVQPNLRLHLNPFIELTLNMKPYATLVVSRANNLF